MPRAPPADDPNPTRRRVLEAVEATPGCSAQDLATRLALSWSTVEYHLRALQKERLLVTHRRGRQMEIFPVDVPETHRSWLAASNDKAAARVLHAVLEDPGLRVPQLSRRLGEEQRYVRRHLVRLERQNLVKRERAGRSGFLANSAPEWARRHLARLLGGDAPVLAFGAKPGPAEQAPAAVPELGPGLERQEPLGAGRP